MELQDLQYILEYTISIGQFRFSLVRILGILIIYFAAQFLTNLIWRILSRYFRRKEVDMGRRFAIQQFLKYVIYTASLLMALEVIGINYSVLYGGAAALLVGIGLGLQQTFNDLVSGIILLIEGSVEVGDVINVSGQIGTVRSINIRTSRVETRDGVSILIPNSNLVGDQAINWSHSNGPIRFQILVGVAYGSDVELVTSLLLKAAGNHPRILVKPKPQILFKDFGSSSLDFELHFYSKEQLNIEFVKSDIRYEIIKLFRTHNVEIPFPQRDLWVRNAEAISGVK